MPEVQAEIPEVKAEGPEVDVDVEGGELHLPKVTDDIPALHHEKDDKSKDKKHYSLGLKMPKVHLPTFKREKRVDSDEDEREEREPSEREVEDAEKSEQVT